MESIGVFSRRWMWVESMGVVVRRYIDFLIVFNLTPIVYVIFFSNITTFCSFKKMFFVLVKVLYCNKILGIKFFPTA